MIDFGCGPATSLLAMAEYQSSCMNRLRVNYIGVDHMPPMLEIAKEFTSALFGANDNSRFAPCWKTQLSDLLPDREPHAVLLNFSYFFGQQSITSESILELFHFIKYQILLKYKFEYIYLIYLNTSPEGHNGLYNEFRNYLGIASNKMNCSNYNYRHLRNLNFQPNLQSRVKTLYHQVIRLNFEWHLDQDNSMSERE